MATQIARVLQGKDVPQYAPNKTGDCFVAVINTDKLNVTGRKMDDKTYHSYSGYPGGITSKKLKDVVENDSTKAVWEAIYGMLPKNKLRNIMMKKVSIFRDDKYSIPNSNIEEVQPK
jgi:large subunit ribosomal protein L13